MPTVHRDIASCYYITITGRKMQIGKWFLVCVVKNKQGLAGGVY